MWVSLGKKRTDDVHEAIDLGSPRPAAHGFGADAGDAAHGLTVAPRQLQRLDDFVEVRLTPTLGGAEELRRRTYLALAAKRDAAAHGDEVEMTGIGRENRWNAGRHAFHGDQVRPAFTAVGEQRDVGFANDLPHERVGYATDVE